MAFSVSPKSELPPTPLFFSRHRRVLIQCFSILLLLVLALTSLMISICIFFPKSETQFSKVILNPGVTAVQWDDQIDGCDSPFCFRAASGSYHLFLDRAGKTCMTNSSSIGTIRRTLYTQFGTKFGCSKDYVPPSSKDLPTIQPSPSRPHRLTLLFLVVNQLSHPSVWESWLADAKQWSVEQFNKREGAFAQLTEEERKQMKSNDIDLFSVKTHFTTNNKERFNSDQDLPAELNAGVVPEVHSHWGTLTGVQYQLLKYGLQDARNSGFVFISDSTLPVKPFSYIYQQFSANPRSRLFFQNVNLPLIRKHDQWIILNRHHAKTLVEHPELWTCSEWFIQPCGYGYTKQQAAAPDEYLPFYALVNIIGITKIWEQINDGQSSIGQRLPVFNWDSESSPRKYYGKKFQHTYLCWADGMDILDCTTLGQRRSGDISEYYNVLESEFKRMLLHDPDVWFARKFSPSCTVEVAPKQSLDNNGSGNVNRGSNRHSNDSSVRLDLGTWLKHELNFFNINDIHRKHDFKNFSAVGN